MLANTSISILEDDYKGTCSAGRACDELVGETEYYLLRPDQMLVRIRLKRKSVLILEGFPNHQAGLKVFAQTENIGFQNDPAS